MLKKFFQPPKSTVASLPDFSKTLEKHYRQQVAEKQIQFDEAQFLALQHLQILLDQLALTRDYHSLSMTRKLRSPPPAQCRSLYMFGDVGRGKSMLMTLFYDVCPFTQKRRVHFNTFMLEVHAFIHHWRQQTGSGSDAISALAKQIRASVLLLCFDEFHVSDIADAMILGRLFSKLFESGVIVVITSNRHPNDLYQGGLQREQFLFFIKVLQNAANIVELVANKDYRLSYAPSNKASYYFPLDEYAQSFIRQCYNDLTHCAAITPGILEVFGRQISLTATQGGIVLSSFAELCVQSLGSADYLAIASRYHTLIMAEIPRLTAEKRNEAKRFVTLIDVLYEHKIKLICSAEVPAHELYTEGDGAFEFRRTVSRLIEMQSEAYANGGKPR